MPGGRPPFYKTPKELQDKVDDYFTNPPRKRKIYYEGKEVGEVPLITVCGLALHLGFMDRQSLYDYQAKPEFTCIIKKARTFIEMSYEELLLQGNCTGAIFALKNMGWRDQHHNEVNMITSKDVSEALARVVE